MSLENLENKYTIIDKKNTKASALDNTEKFNETLNKTKKASDELMNNIISGDIEGLNIALNNIDNQPDITNKDKMTIKEYIEKGDIMGAITKAIDFIGDMFGAFLSKKTGGTFLEEYDDLENDLAKIDFNKMDKDAIKKEIEKLEIKRDGKSDTNKKLSITYIISIFEEQLIKKDTPNIKKFGLLEKNITPGTVLLLNKKSKGKENIKSKAGRLALENYNDSLDVSFTHSVMISSINPTKIIHSTMKKFGEEGSGVQEIELKEYLSSYTSVDILALDMPQDNKMKALNYADKKLQQHALYDDKVALYDLSGGKIGSDDKDKVNCVELIAEGLGDEKIKNISNPNDFLKSDMLTPIYMTTYI